MGRVGSSTDVPRVMIEEDGPLSFISVADTQIVSQLARLRLPSLAIEHLGSATLLVVRGRCPQLQKAWHARTRGSHRYSS